jgi:hypothetical protein
MGWTFPWASSLSTDFNADFNVRFTEEQQREGGIEYNYRREAAWLPEVFDFGSKDALVLMSLWGVGNFVLIYSAALKELAEAYGTTFPLPANGAPHRINDAEVEEAADAVAKHAQSYKKGLKDAFPDDKAALDAAEDSVDALVSAAKKLRSRVDSGKPASGEAGVVREALAAVKTAVGDRKVSEAAAEAWSGVIAGTDKIAQAFGAARPSAETAPTGETR